jgi:DNA adenine methylase
MARAASPTDPASPPRPFVKWVGGKRQILRDLIARVPPELGTYHEPFVGGGALFFAVRPPRAVLSDNNLRLVRTWRGVQKHVEDVIRLLKTYPHDKDFFLALREKDIDAGSDVDVAAWFIYLNKTAYNGLYRVNSKNRFNVPFGRYVNPTLCDEDNLRSCASALRGATIEHEDFAAVLDRAEPGDFVYFDPPYVPLSDTSYFTSYTAEGFGPEDQTRLRDVARTLKKRGVRVLLSNSGAEFVRRLYKGFKIEEIHASRQVNCKAEGRGPIVELVIR